MKEFIFDGYKECINPNRIELGNKEYFIEILTAYHDGFWYGGNRTWRRDESMDDYPALNTSKFATEREAILKVIDVLLKHLAYIKSKVYFGDVPDFIFKELKDLKERYKNPQLSLF
jgi:hypothetical protein